MNATVEQLIQFIGEQVVINRLLEITIMRLEAELATMKKV